MMGGGADGAAADAGAAVDGWPEAEDLVLSTPPCPWHAPRPPFDVVPSLQVTVVSEAAAEVVDAAGAAAVSLAALLLSTPPWPWHAPRPPFDVVPSLHVTVVSAVSAHTAVA